MDGYGSLSVQTVYVNVESHVAREQEIAARETKAARDFLARRNDDETKHQAALAELHRQHDLEVVRYKEQQDKTRMQLSKMPIEQQASLEDISAKLTVSEVACTQLSNSRNELLSSLVTVAAEAKTRNEFLRQVGAARHELIDAQASLCHEREAVELRLNTWVRQ
ncbi:hypothetical protein QFC21_004053 [Naganishia friedmannii]|uniref:Uncharacterized protein n=2 Tax=Naganishia friedmannii TaxID=89922 RepID=A0ACC2VIF9_9TREE|nr:hypothetical protein QFC21_004052 [Naganishia friedmannii]KAJ9099173.1 hypothetical protein QFC21_004053 [Naganishia friedmannii]